MTKRFGFTLAEVLITLGIIGVVAAMTIPTLVANYQQKSMDTAANTFNRKLGEALRVMNVQATLAGHNTTQEFVNELGKHIKIVKTCDSEHLTSCFVSEFSTNEDTYKTEELKQAKNLNKDGNYGSETIGVQFADGVSALVAYNKNAKQDPYSNQVVNVTSSSTGKDLSISLGTDALAILFDVSGSSNPNTYGTNDSGKWKDIRGLNVSIKVGADLVNLGTSYSAVDCSSANAGSSDYTTYCGTPSGYTNDYWAGAKKACADQGMKLPTKDELLALYAKKGEEGIPTSGWIWSASEYNAGSAYYVYFDNGFVHDNLKHTQHSVLCIGN